MHDVNSSFQVHISVFLHALNYVLVNNSNIRGSIITQRHCTVLGRKLSIQAITELFHGFRRAHSSSSRSYSLELA